jgi:hypothetical protein
MVVAPFRQWRITARTSEQQTARQAGRFFVSSESKTELRRGFPKSKSVRNVAGW